MGCVEVEPEQVLTCRCTHRTCLRDAVLAFMINTIIFIVVCVCEADDQLAAPEHQADPVKNGSLFTMEILDIFFNAVGFGVGLAMLLRDEYAPVWRLGLMWFGITLLCYNIGRSALTFTLEPRPDWVDPAQIVGLCINASEAVFLVLLNTVHLENIKQAEMDKEQTRERLLRPPPPESELAKDSEQGSLRP